MRTVLVGLSLVAVSLGAKILESGADHFHDPSAELATNNRDAKFLSVFNIVKFNNDMCSASDGNMGVCYTETECKAAGGVATGKCAQDFGVCCVFTANTCGSSVSQKVSYIESPNYPSVAPKGMCMFTLPKCDKGICSYKMEFVDHVLSQPAMGDCTNDTLMITNVDVNSQRQLPASLCGDLTGHEIYLSVKDATADPKVTFNIVSDSAKWRIKVTQMECDDCGMNVPPAYCLTYNTMTSGTIMSFNNMGGNGESINDHCYSHCIKPQPGFCDVSLSATDFDMGTGTDADSISFGAFSFSGTGFSSETWNYTGTYSIPVCFNGANQAMNSGYEISYLMLPC